MKCKAGDLAVIVAADFKSNIGNIVKIIAPDDGKGICDWSKQGLAWVVTAARPITWVINGKRYRRKIGPVPENRLQPIRGDKAGRKAKESIGLGVAPSVEKKRSVQPA